MKIPGKSLTHFPFSAKLCRVSIWKIVEDYSLIKKYSVRQRVFQQFSTACGIWKQGSMIRKQFNTRWRASHDVYATFQFTTDFISIFFLQRHPWSPRAIHQHLRNHSFSTLLPLLHSPRSNKTFISTKWLHLIDANLSQTFSVRFPFRSWARFPHFD